MMNPSNASVKPASTSPSYYLLSRREKYVWGLKPSPRLKWNDIFCNTFKAIRMRLNIPEPLERHINMVGSARSDDSDLCHDMISNYGFTEKQMHRAAERFHLGCSKSGKTIYWMIDDIGRVRDGHIGTTWVTDLLKLRYPENAQYITATRCFFGLHQISEEIHPDPLMGRGYLNVRATGGAVASPFEGGLGGNAPLLVRFLGANEKMNRLKSIGIVESEKSAVILSEIYPDLLWLAYVDLYNLFLDKFEPLQGRTITLFPRADTYREYYWAALELADQVKRYYKTINITVSRFLEDHASASQKSRHIDLVDYLFENPAR